MKYLKLFILIALSIAFFRTIPDILNDMRAGGAAIFGGVVVLVIFSAIIYVLFKSVKKDFKF